MSFGAVFGQATMGKEVYKRIIPVRIFFMAKAVSGAEEGRT